MTLSAVETAAILEHGLALLQLVVLGAQLGHGEAQLGRAVDEVYRPTPAPARLSTRDRRPTEIRPVPFAAQSDPQASAHDLGGNRSVASVDQPVLVDLIGSDGALGDDEMPSAPKRLLTRPFTCSVTACGLMNTKAAPLRLALSISMFAIPPATLVSAAGGTQDEPSRNNPPAPRRSPLARKLPTTRCTLRDAWNESFGSFKPTRRLCASPCVASSAEAARAPLAVNCATKYAPQNKTFRRAQSARPSSRSFLRLLVPGGPLLVQSWRTDSCLQIAKLSVQPQGQRQRNDDQPRDCRCVA